jgi:PAS domain S-box-containing protein
MSRATQGATKLDDGLIPETDFRLLFQHSPGVLFVMRPDSTVVAANQAALRATMTTEESILGRRLFEVFPDNPDQENPTGVRNFRASINRVLRTRLPDNMPIQRYDIRRPEKEGGRFEERWWSPANSPIFDEDGEVKYIIHQGVEVTDLVLLQQQERQQNKLAEDLRQQTEKMEARLADDEQALQRMNQQLLESNQQLARSQAELREAHETLDAYAKDLEHKVQERTARLEATVKASQDLTYTLAHDLRAPLRAMRGFTEALQEDYSNKLGKLGSDYTRRIHEASGRMDHLIADLLEYGRITHVPLSNSYISLEEEIKWVLEELALVIQERDAEINVDRLPIVCGEKVLVEKILRNLIENALKFVPAGTPPQIRIYATRSPGTVRVWVADNGIGIPEEHQERIFGIFQRLHKQSEFPGTGVGLALVQRSVEHMGGRVGLESSPNKGSRFWIELPDQTHCKQERAPA